MSSILPKPHFLPFLHGAADSLLSANVDSNFKENVDAFHTSMRMHGLEHDSGLLVKLDKLQSMHQNAIPSVAEHLNTTDVSVDMDTGATEVKLSDEAEAQQAFADVDAALAATAEELELSSSVPASKLKSGRRKGRMRV